MESIKKLLLQRNFSTFFLLVILACSGINLYSFNVKVLLESIGLQDLKKHKWKIESQSGFVLYDSASTESGTYLDAHTLSFSVKNNTLCLNGKQTYKDNVYIYPQLSSESLFSLMKFTHDHVQKSDIHLDDASSWAFNLLIDFVPQQKGYAFFQKESFEICEKMLQKFYDHMEPEPVVSFEKLQKYLKLYWNQKFWHITLQSYKNMGLKYKELRKLKKNRLLAKEKIEKLVKEAVSTFMHDFFTNLPQYIVRNFFQTECGHISYNGVDYLGSLCITVYNEKVMLINRVKMDDYLLCVLRSEGWPGWALEINKVLAVAIRTYVIKRIVNAQKQKNPYHIKNTISHQKYGGHKKKTKRDEILREAIKQTHNVFLGYEGKPIDAMFDSCCGGVIPAHVSGYDFAKAPYLARKKVCKYCKSSWIYSWKASYTHQELLEKLKQNKTPLTKIDDIKIIKRDKAGLVLKVTFISGKKKVILTGKKMYSLFPDIKSFCFSIRKQKKQVSFEGKGYGHHIGLCQWGAQNMIKQGYDFKRVLSFYYPGSTFMKFIPEE